MIRSAALGFLLFLPTLAWGSHTIQDGFIILRTAASTNIFYDCDLSTSNPDFTNTATYIYEGENLFIGGEVKTPRGTCNASEAAADVVVLHWSVDGGATNALNLPNIVSGSVDQWQQATSTGMVEIGSLWPVGLHTVDVFFTATDVNHCIAPGFTTYLPASGAFRAMVDVRAGPPDIRAIDDAGQAAYNNGWTNGANGGFGFGLWTNLAVFTNDGDAAGFFVATNPANPDLNFVTSRGRAWGLYANEGGSGGDDLQIAGAFRRILTPVQVGESLSIDFEHGGIHNNVNTGWVGFVLRTNMPPLQFDPDPLSPFSAIQNTAQLGVGFRGGDANYKLYDAITPSGRDTGLGYTTNGVRAVVTLTATDAFMLVLSSMGTNGSNVTITGQTGGGELGVLGVFDRDAEQNDVYFNKLVVMRSAVTNRSARDNAADAAYAGGWTTNGGGFGFTPWTLVAQPGAGAAGHFLATNPPNTDLNAIASQGRAWGMYASGGGIQNTFAYRAVAGSNTLLSGQTFGLGFEHGGIAPNGTVAFTLMGAVGTNNPGGEVFAFGFVGGESEYFINDFDGVRHTGIPFTDGGLRVDFKLLGTGVPSPYALTIDTRGPNGGIYRFSGRANNSPNTLRFHLQDVEQNDAFLNHLYLTAIGFLDADGDGLPDSWEVQNGLNVGINDAGNDNDGDSFLNIEEYVAGTHPTNGASFFAINGFAVTANATTIGSVTGRLYTLERATNLIEGSWSPVSGQVDVLGTGSPLALTNNDPNQVDLFQRVRVRLAP